MSDVKIIGNKWDERNKSKSIMAPSKPTHLHTGHRYVRVTYVQANRIRTLRGLRY